MLAELTGDHAVLDANPHALEPPRVPHLEIRFVRDAAARLIMLVGGSVDVLQNAARADLVDDIAAEPRVRGDGVRLTSILTYMLINTEDPTLRDLRVREAIALALDRPAIIAAQFEGRAVLATGLLAPAHPDYNGDVPRWTRDLPRANALLDEAGLPRGDGGIRAHLVYKTSSDAFRVTVARVIASQLGEVGLDVEVRAFEFATFFADIKKGSYQIATMQTSEITGPDYYFPYFNSERIPTATDPDGNNRTRYRNADVDRLTEAGRHELDAGKRRPMYDEVQRIVARDLPIIPLWHEDNVVLTNVDIEGYTIAPNARFGGLSGAAKRL